MSWTPDKKILAIYPLANGFLTVDWNDNTRRVIDIRNVARGDFLNKLEDSSYFKKAYIVGNGLSVAWPSGQDISPETLYEAASISDRSITHEPRDENMLWSPHKTILGLELLSEGRLVLDWSDNTRRSFDTWAHAGDAYIEMLVDATYFSGAAIETNGTAIAWPDGPRFEAWLLYERAAILGD